jgi:protein-disulfide isomerase
MPEAKKKSVHLKVPKVTLWQALTLIFAVLFVGAFLGKIPAMTSELSSQEAASKVVDYINKNLVQTGSVSLVSVEESGQMYNVTTSYQGQQIPVYVTKDGALLFVSTPLDMSQSVTTTQTTTAMVKTAKPTVELFVMSFCPYGIQAETIMKPVFDLLGSKADFKIKFITSISGNTIDSVQSLHGTNEAKEDLRQVCIMKNYNDATYWNYLMAFDANCPSLINNDTALDSCWKNAATQVGIDPTAIQTCANGSDALNLLKADEQAANNYGVQASPTLIINGAQYGGARSSSAFQQTICSAFTTAPAECSQTISSTASTTAVSGGCG